MQTDQSKRTVKRKIERDRKREKILQLQRVEFLLSAIHPISALSLCVSAFRGRRLSHTITRSDRNTQFSVPTVTFAFCKSVFCAVNCAIETTALCSFLAFFPHSLTVEQWMPEGLYLTYILNNAHAATQHLFFLFLCKRFNNLSLCRCQCCLIAVGTQWFIWSWLTKTTFVYFVTNAVKE